VLERSFADICFVTMFVFEVAFFGGERPTTALRPIIWIVSLVAGCERRVPLHSDGRTNRSVSQLIGGDVFYLHVKAPAACATGALTLNS
jgi:hypothetical protein